MSLLYRPPFRSLFLIYFGLKTLAKVLFWTLASLPRFARPKASWSIAKCLRIYLLRETVQLLLKLGAPGKRDLSKEVPDSALRDAKFVWVDGIDDGVLIGEVKKFAERAAVKPMKIPGYWQLKKGYQGEWKQKANDGEKIIYHIHGGGFWMGSAHPSDPTARIPRGFLEHSQTISRTFAIDYRLSASAPFKVENPFPAGLLDCLGGYQYLIGLGFRAENIILAGDSAGGNLAMGLVRHLTENATGIESPGKLLLLSPWGDISSSHSGPGSSRFRNSKTDMFPIQRQGEESFGTYGLISYLGTELTKEDAKTNRYLSPSSPHLGAGEQGIFAGFPQTYILAGEDEMLLDDAEVIAERMERDRVGQKDWVRLDVVKDAVHDFLTFPWHDPERREALSRISRWIDED